MNEFIEKLIGRLEEKSSKAEQEMNYYRELSEEDASCEVFADAHEKQYEAYCSTIDIVNQLAEECADVKDSLTTDGWIPCSERLPEESGEYYTYVYYDGRYMYSIDEIDCDGIAKEWNCFSDYKIIAWKPIEPYQPKGE